MKTRLYIAHMLESIELIKDFTSLDKQKFINDKLVYNATLRLLQTMGESAKKIPENIRNKYPQIEWREIGDFRNVLVHEYLDGIDNELVWEVIENHLDNLEKVLEAEFPNWKKFREQAKKLNT